MASEALCPDGNKAKEKTLIEMTDRSDEFLRTNFKYFQEWHHWYDKAVSLRKSAMVLYRSALPALRKYDRAEKKARKELEIRPVAQVRFPHPDMLPAFSLFGSVLESAFKGIMVHDNPGLIRADKLDPILKSHKLIDLAGRAGIKLSSREQRVLGWLTEVLIWKARYSVPTNIKHGDKFFDRFDNIRLDDARACVRVIEEVFARAKRAMPRPAKRTGFDVLVRIDE